MNKPVEPTAESLIAEHFTLQDYVKEQNKQLADRLAPIKKRLEAIDGLLHAMLNALGSGDKASIATSVGTAYVSHILNVAVDPETPPYVNEAGQEQVGRMALLDFALEHWDEIGADLLLVQPQKDAVKKWMDEHNGQPPPGLKVGWFSRMNVRRS